jgi:hypothetical protein
MRTFTRRIASALLAGAALAVGGCSVTRVVDIDSKPSGAVIFVNGERRGITRDEKVKINFTDASQRVLIQIVKPRYKPAFQYWTHEEVPDKRIFPLDPD